MAPKLKRGRGKTTPPSAPPSKKTSPASSSTDKSSSTNKVKLEIMYASVPKANKIRFELNEKADLVGRYGNLIEWLRMMGTQQGYSYAGKRSLRCVEKDGAALVEVEVVYAEKSTYFLISRETLYLLAFCSQNLGWRVFANDEMRIVDRAFTQMKSAKACYTGGVPPTTLGPKAIIDALNAIDDEGDEVAAVKAVQVLMVHFSESARFKPIQFMIEQTLMPTIRPISGGVLEEVEHDDPANFPYYMKRHYVDLQTSVEAHPDTEHIIKKFRQLSEAWYVYALSGTRLCPIQKGTAENCGLLDRRLRPGLLDEILGVLCNCNLEGMLDCWSLPKVDGIESYCDFPLDKQMLKDMRKENDEIRRSEKKQV